MTSIAPSEAPPELSTDDAQTLSEYASPLSDDTTEPRAPLTPARIAMAAAIWVVTAVVCAALVLYLLEPMFQSRHQTDLLSQYRTTVLHAAHELDSLAGVTVPTKPPAYGAPVGVLEIARIHLRQVVIEGATSKDTSGGPGHVPGTAGMGQPGNSVVVGRRHLYGGPFESIDTLRSGDRILVTTTQGQSVYEVTSVRSRSVDARSIAALYGATKKNRLTLVTSNAATPWSAGSATEVDAKILGRPFQATPQHRWDASQTGRQGQASAWLLVLGAAALLAVAVIGAIYLYRRSTLRVAYLLTTPALLVAVVLLAEAGSRLLPAWS
jgi:sortase A